MAATSEDGFVWIESRPQPFCLLTRPENVYQALVAPTSQMRRWSGSPELQEFLGESIITAQDTGMRQKTLPAFHRQHLETWRRQIEALAAERLLPSLSGGPLNLKNRFEPFTLEAVGRLLFDADLREVSAEIGDLVRRIAIPTYWRSDFYAPLTPDVKASCAAIRELLRGVFRTQREAIEASPIFQMLRAEPAATEAQIFAEFCGFLLSSIMTTGHVLSAACWHLAHHESAQQELHHALVKEMGHEAFDRVILESLRLCPPVWMIGREATGEVTICSKSFSAGTLFLICPWLMHRISFEQGDAFLPGRWKATEAEAPRGAFLPFSLGVRRCMGQSMSLLLLQIALRSILSRFILKPDERSPEFSIRPGVLLAMTSDTWVQLQPKHS